MKNIEQNFSWTMVNINYHMNLINVPIYLSFSGGTHGSRHFRSSRINQSGMNLDDHSTSSVDGENELISRDEAESSTTAPPIGLERESGVGQTRPPSFQ